MKKRIIALTALLTTTALSQMAHAMNIDFTQNNFRAYIVNDSVMGGISNSQVEIEQSIAIFTGNVSLDYNGGFASIRLLVEPENQPADKVSIRVLGDGQRYKLRLRSNQYLDGPAYSADFDTVAGEWQTFSFTPDDFMLQFRGYRMRNPQPLDLSQLRQVGFMIADKQTGVFELQIDWVRLE